MLHENTKIMLVDDDPDNLWIMAHGLKNTYNFQNVVQMDSAPDALDYIKQHNDVDIILVDRMMQPMAGIDMYRILRKDKSCDDIIVIFQTGKTLLNELNEVIDAGCTYLLKKPFSPEEMWAHLTPVIARSQRCKFFKANISSVDSLPIGDYQVRDFEQAKNIALAIAKNLPNSFAVAEALYQLLENSIEHGNLSIGRSKSALLKTSDYSQEIAIRQELDENANKIVKIKFELNESQAKITLTDQGMGFDSSAYGKLDYYSLTLPNGRGIYFARKVFLGVIYKNSGSEVECLLDIAS